MAQTLCLHSPPADLLTMADVQNDSEALSDPNGRRPPLTDDARDVLEGLDTGDLVLFDRPCLRMGGVFGAAVCAAAKVVGNSPFDHVGVVVRDDNGTNVLVEASFSGIAVRPLCERVRRSSATQICVRQLQIHRTEEMRIEARRFVSEVAHLPYKEGAEGLLQMAFAAFRFHPVKEQRRKVHAETVALSASIERLERELRDRSQTNSSPLLEKHLRRAITQRRKALAFLDDAATSDEQATTTSTEPPKNTSALPDHRPPFHVAPPSPAPSPYDGGMFCSELVAALYQRLGLLDAPFPARHEYVPADFARSLDYPSASGDGHDDGNKATGAADFSEEEPSEQASSASLPLSIAEGDERVALLRGAALGPGCWIRGGPQSPPSPPTDGEDGNERGGKGENKENPLSRPAVVSPFQRAVIESVSDRLTRSRVGAQRSSYERWYVLERLSSLVPTAFTRASGHWRADANTSTAVPAALFDLVAWAFTHAFARRREGIISTNRDKMDRTEGGWMSFSGIARLRQFDTKGTGRKSSSRTHSTVLDTTRGRESWIDSANVVAVAVCTAATSRFAIQSRKRGTPVRAPLILGVGGMCVLASVATPGPEVFIFDLL